MRFPPPRAERPLPKKMCGRVLPNDLPTRSSGSAGRFALTLEDIKSVSHDPCTLSADGAVVIRLHGCGRRLELSEENLPGLVLRTLDRPEGQPQPPRSL